MKTLPTTKQQIDILLDTLSQDDQEKVLTFIQSLSGLPKGIDGKKLVDFFERFPISADEAEKMKHIIEEIS